MLRRLTIALPILVLAVAILPAKAADSVAPKIEDNIVVESFDGTPIVATLMLPDGASADNPVPVVLKTHGWGGQRERTPAGVTERLIDQGFAIFTWDARGFGESGDEAHVDSPQYEVKDVIKLLDYLAKRPEIKKDAPGDVRAGWIGGSYAGGIQLNTSGIDHRVDTLVPEIPWANLIRDLYPNKVLKRNWDQLLYGAGLASATTEGIGSPAGPQTGQYDEHIHEAEAQGTTTQQFDKELQRWFYQKSTILRAPRVKVPTMIMQGSVDTLFPLEDVFDLHRILKRAGTRTKIVTFCGGHTLGCPYPGGATGYPQADNERDHYDDLIVAWINRFVKNNKSVDVGPPVEWQAQNGYYYGAPKYPIPKTKRFVGKNHEVTLIGPGNSGGDGVADGNPAPESEIGSSAVRVGVTKKARRSLAVVGVPKVKIKGNLVAAESGYVFFELIDRAPDGTLVTVDDQTMPYHLKVGEFRKTIALHGVSWLLKKGHSLLLEVTTGSSQYDVVRTGPYQVDMKVRTSIPRSKKVGRRTTS
jgi:ABC-2 type transport system ATP-binding protein